MIKKIPLKLESVEKDNDFGSLSFLGISLPAGFGTGSSEETFKFKFLTKTQNLSEINEMVDEFKDVFPHHKIYTMDSVQTVLILGTLPVLKPDEFVDKITEILSSDALSLLYATDDDPVVGRFAIMKMKWFTEMEVASALDYLTNEADDLYDL